MEIILCVHSETENHSHILTFSHDLRLHGTERLWCVTRIVTRIQIVGFESTHHCGSGRHIIQLMQKRMTLVIHMSKSTNMIFDILNQTAATLLLYNIFLYIFCNKMFLQNWYNEKKSLKSCIFSKRIKNSVYLTLIKGSSSYHITMSLILFL